MKYIDISETPKLFDGKSCRLDKFLNGEGNFALKEAKYYAYLLVRNNDDVQYVGKTRNIVSRIRTHKATKKFSRFYYFECDTMIEASILEILFIDKYSPKHNRDMKINIEN